MFLACFATVLDGWHKLIEKRTNATFFICKQNATQFRTILLGVKGDQQAKRLASQFIARFFTKFPNLANEALDALLDLCEDDDINIRKQAIKVYLCFYIYPCRDMKSHIPKTNFFS